MKTATIKIQAVRNINYRTDASYHLSDGQNVQRYIASSPYPLTTIGHVSEDIFIGNRAKRVYVKDIEHGIPFLSSSDILKANFDSVKLASKKYTPEIERMSLKKGWTLISRSGTIGNCAFANAKHAQRRLGICIPRLQIWSFVIDAGYFWSCYSTHRTCFCRFYSYPNVSRHLPARSR